MRFDILRVVQLILIVMNDLREVKCQLEKTNDYLLSPFLQCQLYILSLVLVLGLHHLLLNL